MKLQLSALYSFHPRLHGYPTDLPRFGALALQRAGHFPPAQARVERVGQNEMATLEWDLHDSAALDLLDRNRVTEEGAEAVALAYVGTSESWSVKRRLQQGERADWLLRRAHDEWLALEVSGTAEGDPAARLSEKTRQVAQCTLAAERLAIVVAFDQPAILAASP